MAAASSHPIRIIKRHTLRGTSNIWSQPWNLPCCLFLLAGASEGLALQLWLLSRPLISFRSSGLMSRRPRPQHTPVHPWSDRQGSFALSFVSIYLPFSGGRISITSESLRFLFIIPVLYLFWALCAAACCCSFWIADNFVLMSGSTRKQERCAPFSRCLFFCSMSRVCPVVSSNRGLSTTLASHVAIRSFFSQQQQERRRIHRCLVCLYCRVTN